MKNILITGGTGTLGKELIRQLHTKAEKIVVFSRDEQKQHKMMQEWPEGGEKGLRYFLGDIRDPGRLLTALNDMDTVIHAAAMKHITFSEYNPGESIKTNILGTMNVAEACHKAGVRKAIFVSTDKACSPVNLYGACKKVGEKYWIAANNMGPCRFSVCRYGNVYGSNGSIIQAWEQSAIEGKPIRLTDPRMTRFWITVQDAAKFIIHKFSIMEGGETFVPLMASCSLTDMIKKIAPKCKIEDIGIRPGEKIHERLIDEAENRRCYKYENEFFTLYPEYHAWTKDFTFIGEKVKEGFSYESNQAC